MSLALPLFGLACVVIVLAAGAAWVAPRMTRRSRIALIAASVLAIPIGWLAVFSLADRLLAATSPVSSVTYASYVGLAIAIFATLQGFGLFLPVARIWVAAAILPVVAIVLASVKWEPTLGGPVAVVLALTLLASAVVLPRALALSLSDRSRAFVGVVAAVVLLLGGSFSAVLGAAAVREGALGLASAERDWRVEIAPDSNETYTIFVPFVAADGAAADVVAQWREHVRVTEGKGVVNFAVGSDVVEVTARGPITLAARYSFHGTQEARASVGGVAVGADGVIRVTSPENMTLDIQWSASASVGGTRCADRTLETQTSTDSPGRLSDAEIVWPVSQC